VSFLRNHPEILGNRTDLIYSPLNRRHLVAANWEETTMAIYVLLHGANQGGWIWQYLTPHLRAAGHTVFAPSLDGCAERRHALRPGIDTESHAAEIADLLFFEDLQDVVLVGTSCGGMVACRTAELARPRIGRIVLADALALFNGEAVTDHVKRPTAVTTELGTGPSREDAANRMLVSLSEPIKSWAIDRITPHPVNVLQAPVKLDSFWNQTWTASVIWCRQSVNPPVAHQRRAAETLKANWQELDTGHYPMLTEPEKLARLMMQG
jgi:pimeloyl-ACP methyl ester carboxylesterase